MSRHFPKPGPLKRLSACLVLASCLAIPACAMRSPIGAQISADFREVVREAKDNVFPAVLFVKCIKESNESGRKISEEISGSGVIISPRGEFLTNWHVVDKATEVRCLLFDGRAFEAKVVGTDKDTDLALVQLDLPPNSAPLPCAGLGDSGKLTEGDFVMAMGAPWGLSRSVSIGIVSCTRRFLPDHSEYSLWLQSDASISPGNSGGPLVNTAGEVVGVNTLATFVGGDMGFSIPSDTVKNVVAQLRQYGKMNWSWTGLQLQPLRDFNRNMYFDAADGVIVAQTDPESPARGAGIQERDRVIKINGAPVTATTEEDLPAVRKLLGLLPKGKPATIELIRNTETITVALSPREKGKVEGEELALPRWDFTVKTVNRFDNPELYFQKKEGVFVYGVKYPGNANDAGLARNDILVKIDGKDADALADVKAIHKEAVEKIATKHRVVITALRNGLMRQIVLDFLRDYEKE